MIRIILDHFLNKRNKILLLIFFIIVNIIFIMSIDFPELNYSYILFEDIYANSYNQFVTEIIKLIIPVSIILILSEHDQVYLKDISLFVGRIKVNIYKFLTYTVLISLVILYVLVSYVLILSIFNLKTMIKVEFITTIKHLWLDSILLLNLSLLLVRIHNKIISILIIIFYYTIGFFIDSFNYIEIYYFIPLYLNKFPKFKYNFIYYVIYNINILLISNLKALND